MFPDSPLRFGADHAEDFECDALVEVPLFDCDRHEETRYEQEVGVLKVCKRQPLFYIYLHVLCSGVHVHVCAMHTCTVYCT